MAHLPALSSDGLAADSDRNGLEVIRTVPPWAEGLVRPATVATPAALPARIDVAVIGGGYTGLAAARALARAGTTVAVLIPGRLGDNRAAPHAGAAMAGLPVPLARLIRDYGRGLARIFWSVTLEAVDLLEELVRTERIDCDFARRGGLRLADGRHDLAALRAQSLFLRNALGHVTALLAGSDLPSEIGSPCLQGALLDESGASFNPAKYLYGLIAAAARAGATLHEETVVQALARSGSRWQVTTTAGSLQADTVLIATGGDASRLVPALGRRMLPTTGHVIATEPLPESLAGTLLARRRICSLGDRFAAGFRLSEDNRLMFGIRRAGFRAEPLRQVDRLRHRMLQIFPQLAGVAVTHAWGGSTAVTWDGIPRAGTVDGIHYVVGCGGHGVPTATWLGNAVGHYLAGTGPATPFHRIRRPDSPYPLDRRWLLPLAAGHLRLSDRWC